MKSSNEMLLEALVTVKEMVISLRENRVSYPFHNKLGICGNVFAVLNDLGLPEYKVNGMMDQMRETMLEWPSRRDPNSAYPVDGIEVFRIEQNEGTIWFSKRRLELLDWLIKSQAETVDHERAYRAGMNGFVVEGETAK